MAAEGDRDTRRDRRRKREAKQRYIYLRIRGGTASPGGPTTPTPNPILDIHTRRKVLASGGPSGGREGVEEPREGPPRPHPLHSLAGRLRVSFKKGERKRGRAPLGRQHLSFFVCVCGRALVHENPHGLQKDRRSAR